MFFQIFLRGIGNDKPLPNLDKESFERLTWELENFSIEQEDGTHAG